MNYLKRDPRNPTELELESIWSALVEAEEALKEIVAEVLKERGRHLELTGQMIRVGTTNASCAEFAAKRAIVLVDELLGRPIPAPEIPQ